MVRHRCKGHRQSKRLIWHFNASGNPALCKPLILLILLMLLMLVGVSRLIGRVVPLPPLSFSDGWRKTAEAAIHALETEEVNPQDAAQSALAAEIKARVMSGYRHQLEVFNDSAEAQALAFQMDLLERRLRLKALRAQRLELYSLSRHHQIGDDVLREVLGELDLSEAKLGQVR